MRPSIERVATPNAAAVMLQVYRNSNITFLRAPVLENLPGVVHAFSTRLGDPDGLDLRPGGNPDQRTRFLSAAGMNGWRLAPLRQIHSNIVCSMTEAEPHEVPEGDGAFTLLPHLTLAIGTADCVPILIAAPSRRAVAVAHAGWRGTLEGVALRTVEALARATGASMEDLYVAAGPHIGVCCMEVGMEVYERFSDPELFEERADWERPHLNLAEANRRQLLDAGLAPERLQLSSPCTRCRSDLFYSFRRDGPGGGRMLSVIGLERER